MREANGNRPEATCGAETNSSQRRQEVLGTTGAVDRIANAARRSAERFQGKNGSMSSGAFPPAAAQLSKYHASHSRGLSFQWVSVANSENIVAANRPLHKRARTIEVLPRHGRAASRSFRSVVVHWNARIIHEPNQSRPVLLQALQNLAAWLAEFEIGKLSRRFGTHRLHRRTQ